MKINDITCLVVEDEPIAAENLCFIIKEYYPNWTMLPVAHSAKEARKIIDLSMPNLVFLDIAMPSETGLEFLSGYPDRAFEVIFTTAYQEFAARAFRLGAIDYLMKPIDEDDFQDACGKVLKRIKTDHAEHAYSADSNDDKILSIPFVGGQHLIKISDITYIEADGNYCLIFQDKGDKIFVSKQLNYFEEVLDNHIFFRAHLSYLVNTKYIKGIDSNTGLKILLTNNVSIPLARRRKQELLNFLNLES